VRSVYLRFILQNVELCHFKRIVPKNVLQAFEWHPCQVQVCCCCSPNVVRGNSTHDTRSFDSVSKYPAQVVVVAVVAFESTAGDAHRRRQRDLTTRLGCIGLRGEREMPTRVGRHHLVDQPG
jgi:hypothetical protein